MEHLSSTTETTESSINLLALCIFQLKMLMTGCPVELSMKVWVAKLPFANLSQSHEFWSLKNVAHFLAAHSGSFGVPFFTPKFLFQNLFESLICLDSWNVQMCLHPEKLECMSFCFILSQKFLNFNYLISISSILISL